jgi:phosphatidylglycerol:prolipoprotein diacylglycerol transferase
MQPTLFFIPHSWLGWPLLLVWFIFSAIVLGILFRRHRWGQETIGFLPIFAIVTATILFVLPNVEVMGINPADPLGPMVNRGLAVRGYGVFMLLAIIAGMGIVIYRCKKIHFPADPIFTLAFWMVIAGVIGARLFFVIQKRELFFGDDIPLRTSLAAMANMTEGGLVVYGSLFGASIAAFIFFARTKLPVWKTADLIAPGMALGLAIGRLGCLMNGCCWGGICPPSMPSLTFPAGAAAYMQHLSNGQLLGLTTRPYGDGYVREVIAVSPDAGLDLGIEVGDQIAVSGNPEVLRFFSQSDDDRKALATVEIAINSKKTGTSRVASVAMTELPMQSLPVHPTQIYSCINALFLCLLLWCFWHYRKSDGEVFALMLILYPVGRFLIEIIRNDESGQFGTELTISQWVSAITIAIGFAMFAYRRGVGSRNDGPIT